MIDFFGRPIGAEPGQGLPSSIVGPESQPSVSGRSPGCCMWLPVGTSE